MAYIHIMMFYVGEELQVLNGQTSHDILSSLSQKIERSPCPSTTEAVQNYLLYLILEQVSSWNTFDERTGPNHHHNVVTNIFHVIMICKYMNISKKNYFRERESKLKVPSCEPITIYKTVSCPSNNSEKWFDKWYGVQLIKCGLSYL